VPINQEAKPDIDRYLVISTLAEGSDSQPAKEQSQTSIDTWLYKRLDDWLSGMSTRQRARPEIDRDVVIPVLGCQGDVNQPRSKVRP